MATTYNHIRMSEVDSSGNVRVMYPETTGADVTISRTGNANIPSTVSTAQGLADKLASSAFTNPISDSTTTTSSTWSSNKINTAVTNISVYVGSSDGKLHFTNSAGTDTALNFSSASGTATAAQVLTGYTFSNSSGKNIPGEMANKGAWTSTGNNCNATTTKNVTIPAGYHNGSGYVQLNSLSSQTGVESGKTAVTASTMFSGYQGWVNGSRVTGTYTAPTITSITPSNASPVALTANNNYKPGAAGYAIASYSSVTPANGTIPSLTSGSIYKMGGAGYAISSYSSVTPSNGNASTAVPSLSSGSIYKMGGAGKAVASVTDVTPSNSSPASVSGYSVYRPTAAGKVVSSITSVSGSSTGTSYSANTILQTTGTVYVYNYQPTHTGTYNLGGTDIVFPTDYGATKDMGVNHSYRYIKIPENLYKLPEITTLYASTSAGVASPTISVTVPETVTKAIAISYFGSKNDNHYINAYSLSGTNIISQTLIRKCMYIGLLCPQAFAYFFEKSPQSGTVTMSLTTASDGQGNGAGLIILPISKDINTLHVSADIQKQKRSASVNIHYGVYEAYVIIGWTSVQSNHSWSATTLSGLNISTQSLIATYAANTRCHVTLHKVTFDGTCADITGTISGSGDTVYEVTSLIAIY